MRYHGQDFDAAAEALVVWEHRYNHDRFSMALRGRTPMEKLAAKLALTRRHSTRAGHRAVSEHALLTCQGGRANG